MPQGGEGVRPPPACHGSASTLSCGAPAATCFTALVCSSRAHGGGGGRAAHSAGSGARGAGGRLRQSSLCHLCGFPPARQRVLQLLPVIRPKGAGRTLGDGNNRAQLVDAGLHKVARRGAGVMDGQG